MRFTTATSASLLALVTLASAQGPTYRVHNNCPTTIELFIAGQSQGSLTKGAVTVKTGLGTAAGFFYTNANGGVTNGNVLAARAGFFFEPNYWYYYLVRDQNSNNFNTGIRIVPNVPESGGYCSPAECSEGTCTTAYTTPPVFHGGPPPVNSPPPNPPVYQCKVDPNTISFDITFCPSGNWPAETGTPIYHNYNPNKCIDVRANVQENGTPVQIYDCNGSAAQKWVITNGGTKVRLAGTNFCLDAGSTPGDGVQMKIWQCYDNLAAQQWFFTGDNRIALEGSGLCLDLPSGNEANSQVLQTWTCGDFNNNQVWTINA
ncbi:G-X-X-X-Q-X-W domain-containing protein [Coprinellus micaceus]|uniref:G-X-X-X-Q-X-W domain-containing protein n=1 Tax=Coprinellus micaceus TaxID=71717 RepID=A0A4Y7TJ06_COPMI|nr:G-X-X-X-Q-X-W domain-containing protein [Coprinellus micaceus]